MPLPMPHPDEKKAAFMHRFMSSKPMMKEFRDKEQRIAVGLKQYGKKGRKKGKKAAMSAYSERRGQIMEKMGMGEH